MKGLKINIIIEENLPHLAGFINGYNSALSDLLEKAEEVEGK